MNKDIYGMSLNEESTFLYLPEEKMLIECGEAASLLLSRSVTKDINSIWLSSPDPQYTAGLEKLLFRFYQDVTIYYPKQHEKDFENLQKIESITKPNWVGVEPGDCYTVGKRVFFEVHETINHGKVYNGFKLCQNVEKLKPEYSSYTQTEIVKLKKDNIEVQYQDEKVLLTYSIGSMSENVIQNSPLWITGDQAMFSSRIFVAKKSKVNKILFIKLDRNNWMFNFDAAYRDVSSGEEYASPIPAVPILSKFSWKV